MGGLTTTTEREDDGRWIAEVHPIPGALAYGHTQQEAIARARNLTGQLYEQDQAGSLDGELCVLLEHRALLGATRR